MVQVDLPKAAGQLYDDLREIMPTAYAPSYRVCEELALRLLAVGGAIKPLPPIIEYEGNRVWRE